MSTAFNIERSWFGFGWLGWELFDCRTTGFSVLSVSGCRAASETNFFIQSCFKEIFGGGRSDANTFSWFLQFPSEQISGYNKLGESREEWWRSIVSDRTSILFLRATLMSTTYTGRARRQRFLLKNLYKNEIFSCFVLLLPWRSSTFRQTNDDKRQNDPEDYLLFSRVQSLHHCLEVGFHDEEDGSVSSTLDDRRANIFVVQYPSKFPISMVLVDDKREYRFCGFALAFDRHAKSLSLNFNAYSSNCISEVSRSLLFKFVTNLLKPWDFLTHEWELSLFTDLILISTPYLPCRQQVVNSNTGPILEFPLIQPFGSSLGKVYVAESVNCENYSMSFVMRYCPTSWIIRNPVSVQNLLNLSCCDNFSIRSPYLCNRIFWCAGSHYSKTRLSWSHFTQAKNSTVLPQRVSPFYRDRIHILYIFHRLSRKDWAGLQK